MGPSSQGNNNTGGGSLAVERYLGSCLISSAAASRKPKKPPDDAKPSSPRHYHIHHPPPPRHNNNYVVTPEYGNGWTGVPLIMANSHPHRRPAGNQKSSKINHPPNAGVINLQPNPDRTPLTRLAIHTQGAPLILSGNYGRRSGGGSKPNPSSLRLVLPRYQPRGNKSEPPHPFTPSSTPASGSSDALSVASDESSGHSENSLPRIIKPRKRRKKERKPSLSSSSSTDSPASENPSTVVVDNSNTTNISINIVTLQPYVPLCYEFEKFQQQRNKSSKNTPEKSGDIKPATSKHIELTAAINERRTTEMKYKDVSPCQCDYCDAATLIWDFDTCYSPSLNPPATRLSSLPALIRPGATEGQSEIGGDYSWLMRHEVLRRSHSEPAATVAPVSSDECKPTNDVTKSASGFPPHPQPSLEVSSKIVTSLNGHRDIEIKFFLPSTC